MAKRREKEFLTEIKHSLQSAGAFFYKIPDSPVSMTGELRFNADKPFDAVSAYKGIPIAIEAKAIDELKSFGLKDLRPSQIEGLTEFTRSCGVAFVLLNVKVPRGENSMYIFEWRKWSEIWLRASTKKSEFSPANRVSAQRIRIEDRHHQTSEAKSLDRKKPSPLQIRWNVQPLLDAAELVHANARAFGFPAWPGPTSKELLSLAHARRLEARERRLACAPQAEPTASEEPPLPFG